MAENEQLTYTDLVRQLTENLVTDLEKARYAIKMLNLVKDAHHLGEVVVQAIIVLSCLYAPVVQLSDLSRTESIVGFVNLLLVNERE